jgi:hypothetical protein
MNEGDLNPRPEQFDDAPYGDERRYRKRGVTAGKVVNWLVLLLVVAAVGFATYLAAVDFVPRWWARQVADQVGKSQVRGIVFGLGVGSIFTFVPILVWAQVRRGFFNWVWRIIVTLVALALAAPNWLTLSVFVGTSRAASDGRALMASSAPGFRNGSVAGAIVGALLALIIVGTSMRLSHRRRQVNQLRGRVSELEQSQAVPAHREVIHGDDVPPSADPQPETPNGPHAADPGY